MRGAAQNAQALRDHIERNGRAEACGIRTLRVLRGTRHAAIVKIGRDALMSIRWRLHDNADVVAALWRRAHRCLTGRLQAGDTNHHALLRQGGACAGSYAKMLPAMKIIAAGAGIVWGVGFKWGKMQMAKND